MNGESRQGRGNPEQGKDHSLKESLDPLDEIIQEVALRHGIGVGRDDPILMTYTINRYVMEGSAHIQRALLDRQLEGMKALSEQMQVQTRSNMEKAMREAATSLRLALREEVQHLFSQQRIETEAASRGMREEFMQWRRLAGFSTFLSVLALATAAMLLWWGV